MRPSTTVGNYKSILTYILCQELEEKEEWELSV